MCHKAANPSKSERHRESVDDTVTIMTGSHWEQEWFASLFPLIVAALYWKRLTAWGAYACVLTAIGCWLYLFRDSEFGANGEYAVMLGKYEVMPVVVIFFSSLVAMVVVSLVTPTPSQETLARHFD